MKAVLVTLLVAVSLSVPNAASAQTPCQFDPSTDLRIIDSPMFFLDPADLGIGTVRGFISPNGIGCVTGSDGGAGLSPLAVAYLGGPNFEAVHDVVVTWLAGDTGQVGNCALQIQIPITCTLVGFVRFFYTEQSEGGGLQFEQIPVQLNVIPEFIL